MITSDEAVCGANSEQVIVACRLCGTSCGTLIFMFNYVAVIVICFTTFYVFKSILWNRMFRRLASRMAALFAELLA